MKYILIFLCVFSVFASWAQDHTTYFCGQTAARERLFSRYPGSREICEHDTRALEQFTQEMQGNRGGTNQVYTIPMVFHVIHENGNENISDEQIYDAIAVLNRDFRKLNPDTSDIIDAFAGIAGDARVEFRLATIDPNGNCHSGINRIVSPLTNDGSNSDMKALSYWPRNKYMNVWICAEIGSGIAGFTNLPGDVNGNWGAFEDGIVLRSDYVGSIGTSSPIKSRTLTHETGHWLNLYHTWGPTNSPADPTNCDFDDNVTDTPNTVGYTSCNIDGASCGSLIDNVQNYMEYSYCSRMFTEGQTTRMRAALLNNTAQRNNLWSAANLESTGVLNPPLCVAAFSSSQFTICTGDTVAFFDDSYHNVISWTWDFGDGQTLSGTDPLVHKNPAHSYAEPGVYNVSLTVSNGVQSLSTTQSAFVRVLSAAMMQAPLVEGFEGDWPGNWITNNPNGDETWEITPNAFYSGSKSLRLRNFNIDAGNVDELYTATIDLTGATAASISYRWAWANRTSTTDDRFRISASADCGVTWSMRKLHKGLTNLPTATASNTFFVPAGPDDWSETTIDLINAQWFNDRFRVKFDFTGYGGNNLYLDDINITAEFPTGVHEAKPIFFFNVYPNPSDDEMMLDVYEQTGNRVHIAMFNAQGQLVSTLHDGLLAQGKHLFTLAHQPAGLYTVVMSKDNHSAIQRVVFR
jgi:PKD repeat protein